MMDFSIYSGLLLLASVLLLLVIARSHWVGVTLTRRILMALVFGSALGFLGNLLLPEKRFWHRHFMRH